MSAGESWGYLEDDDGYTQRAYIKAVPRLHGEMWFLFRPTTPIENAEHQAKARKVSGPEVEKAASEAAAKRIVKWTLRNKAGNLIDISPERLQKFPLLLYTRIVSIVLFGTDGGDEDPLSADDPKHPLSSVEQVSKN